MLKKGRVYTIEYQYSGTPLEVGATTRGGIGFRRDTNGKPFINTVCEGVGSSTWWPSKDQWHDEVDSMEISVSIPSGLIDVSNGAFAGKTDLGDGYTRWDWTVHYPINSYDVSMNIGDYVHFTDTYKDMTLNFYVLRDSLDKAKAQFSQAKGMLAAYEHYFGEYPFKKDGYKLVEATNAGMEHQSAVTYGNGFKNGYGGRDWTGVGVSPRFDFIIIHESGHEWFGNAVSASDRSDMWIHEGWTTYLEVLYVEYTFGYDDALKYVNGYKSKVQNRQPIIPPGGLMRTPPQDMYFKGALDAEYATQRRERRRALVQAAARSLSAVQVSEHQHRRHHRVLQSADRQEFDAGVQSVPAPHGAPDPRAQVRRGGQHGRISLASG